MKDKSLAWLNFGKSVYRNQFGCFYKFGKFYLKYVIDKSVLDYCMVDFSYPNYSAPLRALIAICSNVCGKQAKFSN